MGDLRSPCKGCPVDFDGNGSIGESDLIMLLARLVQIFGRTANSCQQVTKIAG